MEPSKLLRPAWSCTYVAADRVILEHERHPRRIITPPPTIVNNPAWLLDATAATTDAPESTIIVDRVPLPDNGRPDIERLAELAEHAGKGGWKAAAAGLELGTGWITWTRDKDTPVVHMGIRPMVQAAGSLIAPGDTPETIARRLVEYAQLIGAAYRSTPGVAGLGMLRNLYDRPLYVRETRGQAISSRPDRVRYVDRPEPKFIWNATVRLHGAGDLNWQRPPTADERAAYGHVLAYDTRAAYVAAAAGARLGWHAPRNTGAILWDPDQSGMYRIHVPAGTEWADARRGVPIVNAGRLGSDRTMWVAAPILAFLSERGLPLPRIVDSWTCAGAGGRNTRDDRTGQYLRDWAHRLRDAIPDAAAAGDDTLRLAVKRSYAQAVGLMARPGGRVYRQDWAATIIDESRVRLLRKVYAMHDDTGQWPLKVKTDCVWYASDTSDPAELGACLGAGPYIGNLRYEPKHSGTMTDYIHSGRRQAAARRERIGAAR